MEKLKLKAVIESDYFNKPPNLRIDINNDTLFDGPITETVTFERDILVGHEQTHFLNFTLHDKSKYDTVVDVDGNIIQDTLVKIKEIEMDDVNITSMLSLNQDKFYYKHDTGQMEPFYDTMGVNGTATVEFTTPFYVWLLETL